MEFRQHRHLSRSGFTLVEVLMTLTILGVAVGIGTTALAESRRQASATAGADGVMTLIREAQSRSMSARDGQAWGIRCTGHKIFFITYTPSLITEVDSRPLSEQLSCSGHDLQFVKLLGRSLTDEAWIISYNGRVTTKIQTTVGGTIISTSL